ncbi:MAG: 4Fe-4S binding protein [Thermoleophilia bacterium]
MSSSREGAPAVEALETKDDCAPVVPLHLLPSSGEEPNLLHLPGVGALVRSRWYPGVFQAVGLVVFTAVMLFTLFGPTSVHDNPGAAIVWILWWPLLPLSYFLLARFWCTACPFPVVGDFVQRITGVSLPVPRFLKRYGIWIIDALFVLITWGDHVFGIVESPRGTGYLLLALLTGTILTSLFFERRTFCSNLCFLGGLSGNYSMTSSLALRANRANCKDKCRDLWCAKGSERAAACPMFETPRVMETNRECNLCGNCVKSCPHGSLRLELRTPTAELWDVRKPRVEVAVLAMVLVGVVIVQNLTMLSVWQPLLDWVGGITGSGSFTLNFTLVFIAAMAAPLAAMAAVSKVSSLFGGEDVLRNFTRFGYAIIPIDLAAHMGHNLFHLLGEGLAVPRSIMEFFGGTWTYGDALLNTPTIQVLQYLMLGAGAVATAYAAYRIAGRGATRTNIRVLLPHLALIAVLVLVNVYMFAQPMAHRAG